MSYREEQYRYEWLEKHQHADVLVFDQQTGVPHQAIYTYPASTIAHEEGNRAFFEAVRSLEAESST